MKFFMDHIGSSDWTVRRRIVIISLIWEATLITYLVIYPWPNSIAEVAMINLAGLFGGTVGSYIFGAIWDQKGKRKAEIAEAAIDQASDTNINADIEVKP